MRLVLAARFAGLLLLSVLMLLLAACTATTTASETAAPTRAQSSPVPTSVGSDADRRAIYEANGPRGAAPGAAGRPAAVPDATPNTVRLGEQAADINRRKRPGSLNTNDPNLTPPETRLQRLGQSGTDTVRRVP